MKKVLLVSAMVLVAGFSYAQTLIPKAGITLSKVAMDEDDGMKSKIGFTFGLGYNFNITEKFSLQPELNFVQKGFKSEDEGDDGDGYSWSEDHTYTLNYIELPVLAKFTFGAGTTKFYVNAGPSFGFGLGGKFKSEYSETYQGETYSGSDDGKIKFDGFEKNFEGEGGSEDYHLDNRLDIGAQVGGGVIIADKIMVDIRYGLGLSNMIDKHEDFEFTKNKSKNNVIQFTVGVPLHL